MTHHLSFIDARSRLAGMVTLEALIAMIPLMVLIVFALSMWQVRFLDQEASHKAYHDAFAAASSSSPSKLPSFPGTSVSVAHMQLESEFGQQYDPGPPTSVYGDDSKSILTGFNAFMHFPATRIHRSASLVTGPFTWSQGGREWYRQITDDWFQLYDDVFHVEK